MAERGNAERQGVFHQQLRERELVIVESNVKDSFHQSFCGSRLGLRNTAQHTRAVLKKPGKPRDMLLEPACHIVPYVVSVRLAAC